MLQPCFSVGHITATYSGSVRVFDYVLRCRIGTWQISAHTDFSNSLFHWVWLQFLYIGSKFSGIREAILLARSVASTTFNDYIYIFYLSKFIHTYMISPRSLYILHLFKHALWLKAMMRPRDWRWWPGVVSDRNAAMLAVIGAVPTASTANFPTVGHPFSTLIFFEKPFTMALWKSDL